MRLRFWLRCMDLLYWLGWSGGRAWTACLIRASDLTDWGE